MKKRIVKSLHLGSDSFYEVGMFYVTKITEHMPEFEGDCLYYDVYYEGDELPEVRHYGPVSVKYGFKEIE